METAIVLYLIGIIISLAPVGLLFWLGPKYTKVRIIYFFVGLASAALIGLMIYLISIHQWFPNPDANGVRILRAGFSGLLEEIFRYPGILIAQFFGLKYLIWKNDGNEEKVQLEVPDSQTRYIDNEFTKIQDPHGMGMYFGVGYGFFEVLAFYIYPRVVLILEREMVFEVEFEIIGLLFTLTGVMAHTALTYLAMAITENTVFWRITVSSHVIVNSINVVFDFFAPNSAADQVVGMFTRFSLLIVAYFFLKPRVRYQSPAVLLYLLIVLFLLVILISTFIFLLVGFITEELYRLF